MLAAAVQATTAAQRDEAAGSLLTEMKTRSPLEGIESQCHRDQFACSGRCRIATGRGSRSVG